MQASYETNPLLIHLVGSRYGRNVLGNMHWGNVLGWAGLLSAIEVLLLLADVGYAYGFLLSEQIDEAYHSLLYALIGDKWYDQVSFN